MKRALIMMMAIFSIGGGAKAETKINPDNVYAKTAIVTEIDRKNDLVTVRDGVGYEWQFYGVEDWMIGDYASMVMYDNKTKSIFDDSIIDVKYEIIPKR